MATLEERASIWGERLLEAGCSKSYCNGNYSGYIKGATEQKTIDEITYTEEMRKLNEEWKENLAIQRAMLIDKACEWIMDELFFPKADTFQEFVDNFRKAMEE